ncbi:MAG: hypothetical protein ACRDXE_08605 [Acidimicrobiales bacterium]
MVPREPAAVVAVGEVLGVVAVAVEAAGVTGLGVVGAGVVALDELDDEPW